MTKNAHSSFVPDATYDSVLHIDVSKFGHRKNVIIDVDNTLLMLNEGRVDKEIVHFFRSLMSKKIIDTICLVSNVTIPTKKRLNRLRRVAEQLEVPYIPAVWWKIKPHHRPFLRAMEIMKSTSETTAIIGDQILTDIRGGNRLGLYTILVKPLGKDKWFTQIRRWFYNLS